MKKFFIFIPLLTIVFSLTSCDPIKQLSCEHEYKIYSINYSTCATKGNKVEVCIKCEHEKETTLPLLEHEFEELEIQATCEHEGKVYQKCKNCKKEKISSTSPKLPHEYSETVYEATCENDGYTLKECTNCSYEEKTNLISALGHDLSNWTVITTPTDTHDGLRNRTCSRCDFTEEEIILSTSYIDLSLIREPFDNSITYEINSYDELLLKFKCAVINQSSILKCKLNFKINDLQTTINSLVKDTDLIFSFQTKTSYSGDLLTLDFVYLAEPSLSTSKTYYTQYKSFNYNPIEKVRPDDFDHFLINTSLYSFNVSTTDQLFYALECGAKPICKPGSSAEKAYNELKKILIEIIHDDMNDFEKVKAIHDYLVMDIVYDHDLLLKLYQGDKNLKDYNGFYLEGALFDKKAVCEGISKSFTALCNIEGIPCITVEGIQTSNPSGAGHAWNKVYIEEKWYIVDTTSDGTILNNEFEVLSYKFFLINEKQYSEYYTGTNFTNVICENNYNYYEHMNFIYNDKEYDFNITSQEELNTIIAYFEKTNIEYSTIEFRIDFDFGDSCLDEIKLAYQTNNITNSYFYINNADSFMIIKKVS